MLNIEGSRAANQVLHKQDIQVILWLTYLRHISYIQVHQHLSATSTVQIMLKTDILGLVYGGEISAFVPSQQGPLSLAGSVVHRADGERRPSRRTAARWTSQLA